MFLPIYCEFKRVGIFLVFQRYPIARAIAPFNKKFPASRCGLSSFHSIRVHVGPLALGDGVVQHSMVDDRQQHHLSSPLIVNLSKQVLCYQVGSQFFDVPVHIFNFVLS